MLTDEQIIMSFEQETGKERVETQMEAWGHLSVVPGVVYKGHGLTGPTGVAYGGMGVGGVTGCTGPTGVAITSSGGYCAPARAYFDLKPMQQALLKLTENFAAVARKMNEAIYLYYDEMMLMGFDPKTKPKPVPYKRNARRYGR